MNGQKNIMYISKPKAGFRKHMGTLDDVFVLHGIILNHLNNNKKVICSIC